MEYKIFKSNNYKKISLKYHIPTLVAKVIDQRGLNEEDLKSLFNPRLIYHDFSLFEDCYITLDRIEEAIENGEKICIYGDYDCDGIMATSILVQAFFNRGVKVGYHIPDRFKDGYGLNVNRVKQIASKGYTLIITVDNGIMAYEAIEYANTVGVDVIVTDHHEFEQTPNALSIIHTKISPDYPFKSICGGFIAYKLAVALNHNKHDKYLYSLACISTISDMMPLLDENRSLIKRGLEFINQEKYQSITLLAGNNKVIDANTIGYIIAPKINSLGRLPEKVQPNILVKYFLENTPYEYLLKVSNIANKINELRKELTNTQYNLLKIDTDLNYLYYGSPSLHEGLLGLIANKYTRQYESPSFIMHLDEDTGIYKGSARSVKGFSIHDFFEENNDLLLTYGGHDMAGGFSLKKDNYDLFNEQIKKSLQNKDIKDYKDVILLHINDINLEALEYLEKFKPFGQANEEPLFILENINNYNAYTLSNGKHLKIDIELNNNKLSALFFNKGSLIDNINNKSINIIGNLQINNYNNNKYLQFIIKDIKPNL